MSNINRISSAMNSPHFAIFEGAIAPFFIFYSRFFSVGLMNGWGIVLASFGSRCVDLLLVTTLTSFLLNFG